MGRTTRRRWVKEPPNNLYFSNTDNSTERVVTLSISEFEAMRLKHYLNLNQQSSAANMGVSQPTFSRILESAHKKATQALIEGKTIKISGGHFNYKKSFIGYGCLECNHEWEDLSASKERTVECPICKSKRVYFLVKETI
ncbi:MAG: DUF134 domain-containing protein [Promethearchaeota archaeon]|jgi:predicted DNA-binding protein (UPF0251 family)